MVASEVIGIELRLMGADEAEKTVGNLVRMLEKVGGRRTMVKLDDGRVVSVNERIKELEKRLAALRTQKDLDIISDDEISEMNQINAELRVLRAGLKGAKSEAKSFGQTFKSISASVAHVGGAMQTFGNTLTRISTPARSLLRGTIFAAGYKAFGMLTSGFGGMFERYDIMNTYAKSLSAIGLEADKTFKVFAGQKEAMTAIENLNESVLGLPTGLDEIVAVQKQYAGATGEMVKSTKLAIATNNAFISQSTQSKDQRNIKRYLSMLASGTDLTTTQWESMRRIMPLAMREVAKEMKYADFGKFTEELKSGAIAGQDFLKAFIEVGTNGRVQAAANVMKTTWGGLAANLSNATKRMGEGMLKALDDVFKTYNGRNLVQNLLGFDENGNKVARGIKDVIDDISSAAQNWIRENPQKIIDFMNSFLSIDWKGLGLGFIRGVGDIAKGIKMLADLLGGRGMSWLSRSLMHMSWLGTAFTALGGVVRGMRHPIALIATLAGRGLAKVAGKGGLFARLAGLFGSLSAAKKAKDVADYIPSVADSFKLAFSRLSGAITALGTIALGVGTGVATFKGLKSIINDMHDVAKEINSFSREEWVAAASATSAMIGFISAFTALSTVIGGAVGSLSALAETPAIIGGIATGIMTAIIAFDFKMVSSAFHSFFEMTDYLKTGMQNLKELGSINVNTGRIEKALGVMSKVTGIFAEDYELAKEGGGGSGVSKISVANNISKQISEIIDSIKKTLLDLDSLPEISDADVTAATDKIKNTIEKMGEIASKVNLAFDTGIMDGLAGLPVTKGRTKRGGDIAKNIGGVISNIKTAMADLKALESIDIDLDAAEKNVVDIGNKMGSIFRSLNAAFGRMVTTDSEAGNWSKVENLGVDETQQKKASALKTLFDSYQQTIASIKQIYQSLVGGEGDSALDLGKFQDAMSKLTGEKGIIPQLKEMYYNLVSEETGFGAETDVDLAGIMDGFQKAVESIRQAVVKLQEIEGIELGTGEGGGLAVVGRIKSVISQLKNAFSTDAIGELQAQIDAFKAAIETALQSIADLGTEVEIDASVKLAEGFGTSVDAVVSEIDTAASNIKSSWGKIPTSLSKTITITIKYKKNIDPFPSVSIPPGYSSTGGYIAGPGRVTYRAKGGSIFRPRGTDTVPAMLTPGEYVQNKRAVDFFGIDFMRKVNHLDVQGALQSLMTKAGGMASASTTINNYNNQKVVINNHGTPSAGYTFKRASRFVGAI